MIAVTGANGFIGSSLIRELNARGKKVRAIVRSERAYPSLEGLEIEQVVAEVSEYSTLEGVFEGVDELYHVAGMVSLMPRRWHEVYKANVLGTQNVIEAAIEQGVKRLVYTSSVNAFPSEMYGVPIEPVLGQNDYDRKGDYARTKAIATREVLLAKRRGIEVIAVAPTAVLGPYDLEPTRTGTMLRDVALGKVSVMIKGAYDFVDVRDIAIGHILAMEKGKSGEAYLLGGHIKSVKDLVEMTAVEAGAKVPQWIIPGWVALVAAWLALPYYYFNPKLRPPLTPLSIQHLLANPFFNSDKAKDDLGYDPRPLKKSVEDTLAWMREVKWI